MPRLGKVGCVSSAAPTGWRSDRLLTGSGVRRRTRAGRPTLLWIDDFEPGLAVYQAMFENLGFSVLTASSGKAGITMAALNRVDVVVTDYEMPEMNGETVAASIKAIQPGIPIILFSGSTLVPLRARRVVDAFCDKAGSRDHLLATIHRLLYTKRTRTLQPPPIARASDHGHRTVA